MNKQIVVQAVHTIEYYLAIKKNGLLGVVGRGIESRRREKQNLSHYLKFLNSFLVSFQDFFPFLLKLICYYIDPFNYVRFPCELENILCVIFLSNTNLVR